MTRHRVVVAAWVLLLPVVMAVGLVHGLGFVHVPLDLLPSFGPTLFVLLRCESRRARASAVSLGLMAASGTFVHFTGGLIEAHFLFFVLLPLVALYQDWVPFALSIGFVLVHHAVIGVMAPTQVYNHSAAIHDPVLWAAIHATFVAGLVVVLCFYWYWSAREQRELAAALADLQRTQAELVQAQKLESIGQLAAGVAHEINTPIQFVGDNLRFLEDGFRDLFELVQRRTSAPHSVEDGRPDERCDIEYFANEVPDAIAQSLDGIARVAEIIRALKGIAHPDADAFVASDINKLIRDTVVVSRTEWKYVAELATELDDEVGLVECAPGPLHQVVLNLIINAAHAIEDRFGVTGACQGRIHVVSRRTPHAVEIEVRDNGCGIPAAVRARVFDPFFTTKPVGRGTGQGLAISHAVIVGQHRGTISINSTEGEGTTFTLSLPTARADSACAA